MAEKQGATAGRRPASCLGRASIICAAAPVAVLICFAVACVMLWALGKFTLDEPHPLESAEGLGALGSLR